jgi:hypothetical protein
MLLFTFASKANSCSLATAKPPALRSILFFSFGPPSFAKSQSLTLHLSVSFLLLSVFLLLRILLYSILYEILYRLLLVCCHKQIPFVFRRRTMQYAQQKIVKTGQIVSDFSYHMPYSVHQCLQCLICNLSSRVSLESHISRMTSRTIR